MKRATFFGITSLRTGILVASLCLTAIVTPLHSAIVTVDPDLFAAGTDISSAFPGVTLSSVGGGYGADAAVFGVNPSTVFHEPFSASTGSLSFGHLSVEFPHVWRELGFLVLRADFAAPTNFVAIDFISNDASDVGFLQAFDAANNLVGSYQTAPLGANQFESMFVSSASYNIAYLLAGGATTNDAGGLDRLRYESAVPEPGTFGLAGAVVLAFGLCRIGKRRRPKVG